MSGKRGSLQLQNRKTSFRSTLSCERKKAEREDIIVTFMKEKEKGTIGKEGIGEEKVRRLSHAIFTRIKRAIQQRTISCVAHGTHAHNTKDFLLYGSTRTSAIRY